MAISSEPEPSPDAGTAAVLRHAGELRRVKREAGEPSLRQIERLTGRGLTIATMSRMLNGKAVPSWFFTRRFLSACGIDENTIETVWRPKWVQMADVRRPLDSQPPVTADEQPGTSPSTTCPECGLVVGDPDLHRKWHETQDRPAPPPTALHVIPDVEDGKPWIQRRKAS